MVHADWTLDSSALCDPSVSVLRGADNKQLVLVGTAHISEESALLDDRPPELRLNVKYALPRPQKEPGLWEFAFNSEQEHADGRGRFHEFAKLHLVLASLLSPADGAPPGRAAV